jgi:rhodanese-related sulfurtransferase
LLLWLLPGALQAQSPPDSAFQSLLQGLLAHSVPEVSAQGCQGMAQALRLDARERHEYEVSRLPGAKWVGYTAFQEETLRGVPKSQPIVVYCTVGYRSEKIAERLRGMGFGQVYNLYGGIFAWKNAGFPVVDAQGKPTERVHTYNEDWGRWLRVGQKVP